MPIFKQNTKFERGVDLNGNSRGTYIVKNWHPSKATANLGNTAFYQDALQQWYSFGDNGTDTNVSSSVDGSDWFAMGTIANFYPRCSLRVSHVYGLQGIVIGGGLPSSSTNAKIRRSNDGGVTWEPIVIGLNDILTIADLNWSDGAKYLALLGTQIYRSAVGDSGTYSVVQNTAEAGLGICTNLSDMNIVYCIVGSAFYTSADGITWTPRTFPNSFVATGMAYGIVDGENGYLAVGTDNIGPAVYSAVSGAVWGLRSRFPSGYTTGSIASVGDLFVARAASATSSTNIWYSSNGGLNWSPATTFSGVNPSIVPAKRIGGGGIPHQVGIFVNGQAKMSIVG